MAQSDDVTPVGRRLLRALGLPPQHLHQHHRLGLQRSPVSASGRPSAAAASAAVFALHRSTASPEAIAPVSLELEAWPSEPSTPSTTATDSDSSECGEPPATVLSLRRQSSYSPLCRLRGHTRANSLDSTTTDVSVVSSSSTSSTRSRWNIFAPAVDELTASNRRPDYANDKRNRQAREVWREYW